MKSIFSFGVFILLFATLLSAQSKLKSGFDSQEYKEVLTINSYHFDSTLLGKYMLAKPTSTMKFRSKEVGLDNRWDYWIMPNGVGVISIRGTAPTKNSWLENFYAAMIPAIGEIKNTDSTVFKYKFAAQEGSYVHAGWVFGLSFMAEDIANKMKGESKKGINDFILVGHSQGGALAMLLRSYLQYMKQPLPSDIRIKTYASAPPKPGNQKYAYDFEFINQGGWAFRVVNSLDWVPEVPFTVQRMNDLNKLNPFVQISELSKEAPWYARAYIKGTVRKLDRKATKAQKQYTKILGKKAWGFVSKELPTAVKPELYSSFNYVVCGSPIILVPTNNYIKNYVDKSDKHVFIHHHFYAYWFLVNAHFPERG